MICKLIFKALLVIIPFIFREKIYGYKDLDVTLLYTQATMFPHLVIKYSEKIKQGPVKVCLDINFIQF